MPTPAAAPVAESAKPAKKTAEALFVANLRAIGTWYEAKGDVFPPSVVLIDVAHAFSLAQEGVEWKPKF